MLQFLLLLFWPFFRDFFPSFSTCSAVCAVHIFCRQRLPLTLFTICLVVCVFVSVPACLSICRYVRSSRFHYAPRSPQLVFIALLFLVCIFISRVCSANGTCILYNSIVKWCISIHSTSSACYSCDKMKMFVEYQLPHINLREHIIFHTLPFVPKKRTQADWSICSRNYYTELFYSEYLRVLAIMQSFLKRKKSTLTFCIRLNANKKRVIENDSIYVQFFFRFSTMLLT